MTTTRAAVPINPAADTSNSYDYREERTSFCASCH
jgi:hypothetical protein